VSEAFKPVPMKVTVDSSVEFVGNTASVGAADLTVTIDCAKSPTLGAQPLFPRHPVTSITYSPDATLPIMKLPLTMPVPTVTTQAEEPTRIGLGLLVLLIEHD